MKTSTFGALALAFSSIGLAAPAVSGTDVADTSTRTPADAVEWIETPFGPLASPIVGNFAEGQHVTMIKFGAGLATPVHAHTHDYTGVVVTGVTRHYVPGKPETKVELAAGSVWSIPADLPHISECLAGEDCIMVLYQDHPFDFLPIQ